jgi:hypothetical protein
MSKEKFNENSLRIVAFTPILEGGNIREWQYDTFEEEMIPRQVLVGGSVDYDVGISSLS